MKLTIGKLISIIILILYWIGILIGYCYLTYNMYLNNKLIIWYTIGLIVHLLGILFAFAGSCIFVNLFQIEDEYYDFIDKLNNILYKNVTLPIKNFLKTEIKIK